MEKPPVEEEELYSSWALLILTSLIILSLFSSYYLQRKQIRALHETVISIFAGMLVGLIIRMSPGSMIQDMVTFNYTYFFNLLLPPIILNTGYEMKKVRYIYIYLTISLVAVNILNNFIDFFFFVLLTNHFMFREISSKILGQFLRLRF